MKSVKLMMMTLMMSLVFVSCNTKLPEQVEKDIKFVNEQSKISRERDSTLVSSTEDELVKMSEEQLYKLKSDDFMSDIVSKRRDRINDFISKNPTYDSDIQSKLIKFDTKFLLDLEKIMNREEFIDSLLMSRIKV